MRSVQQEFGSTLDARVSPPSLMTQQELPPLGDVVLELGAGANPHPRATIHHDRIIHADWIDVAHDLTAFPWPWGDASVDAVIAIDVFEHLKDVDVQTWLDECWRISSRPDSS
jgi:predicted SAM-dependent methyltransferase